MVKLITYKVRVGNAIPILCDKPEDASKGNVVFTFGTETQEVISCSADDKVVGSKDMCMRGGFYFSANYRALPGKVNGRLVFNSVLTKDLIRTNTYPKCQPGSVNIDTSRSLRGDFNI